MLCEMLVNTFILLTVNYFFNVLFVCGPEHKCEGQRTACRSQFSAMWVQGVGLGFPTWQLSRYSRSGLQASA